MPEVKIERTIGPARRAVLKGLRASNRQVLGDFGFKPLAITLRHKRAIVGGLLAETYLGWMFIALLWVADEFRGKGFGSKVMRLAEKEARRRGIKNAYVDTFSFQAPGFYRKLGYREFGRLAGFPRGHHRSWLSKAL